MSHTAPLPPSDGHEILTVTELNRRSRRLLELSFGQLWVEGELSNFARPRSGHWYFTLKDQGAQIRCAFFKNRNRSVSPIPSEGDQVIVRGRVSLYEGRGDYQLIVEHLESAGFGALQQAFEALKCRLANEGLFDENHKKALPRWPQHLGVITSPSGAALHDVRSVLARRFPLLPVTLFPTAVQGEAAADQIVSAIEQAEQSDCDVILLTRGGGSLEDLWPFNEERVARAIAACSTPVVSAVGHEVDYSISDWVADLRAPTPSAAAELISPDQFALLTQLERYQQRFEQLMQHKLLHAQQTLTHLQRRLRHPGHLLDQQAQHLDELDARLNQGIAHQLLHRQYQLQQLSNRLQQCTPSNALERAQLQLKHLKTRLNGAIEHRLQQHQQRLATQVQQLELVSPLATLSRGYALVQTADGQLVQRADQLSVGDCISARLGEGAVQARVEKITPA